MCDPLEQFSVVYAYFQIFCSYWYFFSDSILFIAVPVILFLISIIIYQITSLKTTIFGNLIPKKGSFCNINFIFFFYFRPATTTSSGENLGLVICFLLILVMFLKIVINVCSLLVFIFKYRHNQELKEMIPLFKNLPLLKKFFFLSLSYNLSIPNKILINNNLSPIFIRTLIFLLILLASNIPIIYILLGMCISYTAESYFFGKAYEKKNSKLKTTIIKWVFNGDETFSKMYFKFFYGNIFKKGLKRAYNIAVGASVTVPYLTRRDYENQLVRYETQADLDNFTSLPRVQNLDPTELASTLQAAKASFTTANRSNYPIARFEDGVSSLALEYGAKVAQAGGEVVQVVSNYISSGGGGPF